MVTFDQHLYLGCMMYIELYWLHLIFDAMEQVQLELTSLQSHNLLLWWLILGLIFWRTHGWINDTMQLLDKRLIRVLRDWPGTLFLPLYQRDLLRCVGWKHHWSTGFGAHSFTNSLFQVLNWKVSWHKWRWTLSQLSGLCFPSFTRHPSLNPFRKRYWLNGSRLKSDEKG